MEIHNPHMSPRDSSSRTVKAHPNLSGTSLNIIHQNTPCMCISSTLGYTAYKSHQLRVRGGRQCLGPILSEDTLVALGDSNRGCIGCMPGVYKLTNHRPPVARTISVTSTSSLNMCYVYINVTYNLTKACDL